MQNYKDRGQKEQFCPLVSIKNIKCQRGGDGDNEKNNKPTSGVILGATGSLLL